MKRLVEFPLEGEQTIVVEVEDPVPEGGIVPAASLGQSIAKAGQSFDEALEKIKDVSTGIISKLRELPEAPDEITVTFGVKLGGEAGIILASGTFEANYTIELKWKKG